MTEIHRQVRLDATPRDVAAALATSPWRSAMAIEPDGAGSRVVIRAEAEPAELARVIENLALDEVCRLRAAPDPAAPAFVSSRRRHGTVVQLERSVSIDAPVRAVWAAISDAGNVDAWTPTVRQAEVTSESTVGVGTTRECRLVPVGVVQERVTAWVEERLLTVEIYEQRGLPAMRHGAAMIELEPDGARTTVRCRVAYEIGLGPLGAALNRAGFRRLFTRSLVGLLAGLKLHVETGERIETTTPLPTAAVRAA